MLNIISTTTLNIPVQAPNNEPKQHKKPLSIGQRLFYQI